MSNVDKKFLQEAERYARDYLFSHNIPITQDRINAFNIGYAVGYERCYDEHKPVVETTLTKCNRVRDLRIQFWNEFPDYKDAYFSYKKTQNDYPTDVRCAWVDFVERMRKDGLITDRLANNATL